LWSPPALKITALEIVKTIQAEVKSGTKHDDQDPRALRQPQGRRRTLHLEDRHHRHRREKTAWFLFADPAQLERPAVEIGFLRGLEEPQLFMKSANASMIGGGDVGAFGGDFDSDSIEFKIRHIVGGAAMDYRGAVGSFGK